MTARCNLITGHLGAGKTTLIRHLLATRPADERWAVIVNEFGVVGIDGTTLASVGDAQPAVAVREVAGGCICCAANVPLRVAITDVLRRVRPDRLLIEPSGLGHPAAILATLAEPGLARAIEIGAVICIADPRQLDPHFEIWRDQLAVADVVVANKRDLASDAQCERFLAFARSLYPPKQAIVFTTEGRIEPALLDAPRARWRPVLLTGHATGAGVDPDTAIEPARVPGLGTRYQSTASGGVQAQSIGWLFDDPVHEGVVFDADKLDRLMMRLPALVSAAGLRLLRAKGAFRTDHGSRLIEWSSGQLRAEPLAFVGVGRFEVLVDATTVADASTVESALQAALEK